MNIEDHFKSVDWGRISRMEKATEEMSEMGIILFLVLFGVLLAPKPTPLAPLMIVMCLADLAYSGYNYFKWSSSDVLRASEPNEVGSD